MYLLELRISSFSLSNHLQTNLPWVSPHLSKLIKLDERYVNIYSMSGFFFLLVYDEVPHSHLIDKRGTL